MNGQPARVLVLTLYSGEAEYTRCCDSLAAQSWTAWEQRRFEHLPNVEAHARVYRTIEDERADFALFFKLDADMVLADERFSPISWVYSTSDRTSITWWWRCRTG